MGVSKAEWAEILQRWAQDPEMEHLDFQGVEVPAKVREVLEAWAFWRNGAAQAIEDFRRSLPEVVLDKHGRPRSMPDVDWALGQARTRVLLQHVGVDPGTVMQRTTLPPGDVAGL